ncbi:homeobox-leucine zipper protein HOX28 [Brachypodium distachyon]|uniref:Homeobox domain-containing protein n=1 Tax=Brachypodium distachyon TaxID=15368 RepID=I1H1Q4_BRADI|nr:homeobox-leucine zipper protein HOX28 [Brachypodium distachyon]KQK19923.1 hypothetical protein BRADI_1g51270v3 [Brachypodium distachyon]|eukprot:XP_003557217.1 homeobox-leucine zipper protein HOX28 [Brachypodium distachyon]
MAPQSLDLGLSLGLGFVSSRSGGFVPYSGDAPADREQEVAMPEEERTTTCSPGSPASSGGSGTKRSAGSGDEDDVDADGGGINGRKKLRLSKDQAAILEECFKTHHTLTPKQKLALANSLGLRPRQVEVWFQNRRARTKLKQTEVDCEHMKRWCEQLVDQNRRLEKELADLRAAAPAPAPPLMTTLTMCLSCKSVASSSSSSPACAPNAGIGMGMGIGMPGPAAPLTGQRQFWCGYRETAGAAAAAYGVSSGLAKAVKPAR